MSGVSGSAEEQSGRQLVGSSTGAVKEGSSLRAKVVNVLSSLGLTTLLPSARTGNVEKDAKLVKKAKRIVLLVDIN
jgi:hypothetical protein